MIREVTSYELIVVHEVMDDPPPEQAAHNALTVTVQMIPRPVRRFPVAPAAQVTLSSRMPLDYLLVNSVRELVADTGAQRPEGQEKSSTHQERHGQDDSSSSSAARRRVAAAGARVRHLLGNKVAMASTTFYEVEKILKRRIKNGRVQYFLKWKGFPDSDNSWEPASNVTEDLVNEFEKTNGPTSSSRKKSPNRSITLSPPIRKPVSRRTTSAPLVSSFTPLVSETSDEVKEEAGLSETATDEEIRFAEEVYREMHPDKVTGAVVLRHKLFLRTKWTDGTEDLVPAKFANHLFPDHVIAFYQANICLHDLK